MQLPLDGARYRNRKKLVKFRWRGKSNLDDDDLRIPILRVYVDVCVRMCVVCLKVTGGEIVSCWNLRDGDVLNGTGRERVSGGRDSVKSNSCRATRGDVRGGRGEVNGGYGYR